MSVQGLGKQDCETGLQSPLEPGGEGDGWLRVILFGCRKIRWGRLMAPGLLSGR